MGRASGGRTSSAGLGEVASWTSSAGEPQGK